MKLATVIGLRVALLALLIYGVARPDLRSSTARESCCGSSCIRS